MAADCNFKHTIGERLERIERYLGFSDTQPAWAPITKPVIAELPCECKDPDQDCCGETIP